MRQRSPFLKGGLVNVRLAIVLETATTLGALTGVLLVGVIPTAYLFFLFALILILSAQQMLSRRGEPAARQRPARGAGPLRFGWTRATPTGGKSVEYRVHRLPLGMVLMYGAGLISALLGIGSGVLKIPAMDTALRLPIKVSSATSNFMIGVTAAASAGAYFMRGDIVTCRGRPCCSGFRGRLAPGRARPHGRVEREDSPAVRRGAAGARGADGS